MPDSAVSIIADTLRTHRLVRCALSPEARYEAHCHCGWTSPQWGYSFECTDEHEAHVAAAVVDALGGLTRAWAAVLPDDSYFTPYHEGHEFHPGEAREQAVADVAEYEDSRLSSRWVSGWVREPAEENRDA